LSEKDLLREKTDEELILVFQESGSIPAFELLVDRYKNSLMNYIFRYTGDRDLAKDIVQDSFIRVYKKKALYKQIAKFSTWLYTIALNITKTEIARQQRRNVFSISAAGDDDEPMPLPAKDPLPEDIVDSGIKEAYIQQAMMKIPEVYREAVILRDIQEFSYEEIAEMLEITIGTVKSRINRGRALLQHLLEDIYSD
jgi:RNA polymerase sigma-70 factor (ECF subfamily)